MDGGEANQLRLLRLKKNPGEKHLQGGAPILVGHILKFINDDEFHIAYGLRLQNQEGEEFLINNDGNVVIPG